MPLMRIIPILTAILSGLIILTTISLAFVNVGCGSELLDSQPHGLQGLNHQLPGQLIGRITEIPAKQPTEQPASFVVSTSTKQPVYLIPERVVVSHSDIKSITNHPKRMEKLRSEYFELSRKLLFTRILEYEGQILINISIDFAPVNISKFVSLLERINKRLSRCESQNTGLAILPGGSKLPYQHTYELFEPGNLLDYKRIISELYQDETRVGDKIQAIDGMILNIFRRSNLCVRKYQIAYKDSLDISNIDKEIDVSSGIILNILNKGIPEGKYVEFVSDIHDVFPDSKKPKHYDHMWEKD